MISAIFFFLLSVAERTFKQVSELPAIFVACIRASHRRYSTGEERMCSIDTVVHVHIFSPSLPTAFTLRQTLLLSDVIAARKEIRNASFPTKQSAQHQNMVVAALLSQSTYALEMHVRVPL